MNALSTTSPAPRWLRPLDRLGSVLSTACAVHCLLMPLVVAALPMLASGPLASRAFERAACGLMVALASFCLWRGCRTHGRWGLFILLGGGAVVTHAVQWFGPDICCAKERANWTEALVMCVGGLAIASAHLLNLRLMRRCDGCPACS